MNNDEYNFIAANLVDGNAVSLLDAIANRGSINTLKQRVRLYSPLELIERTHKKKQFLILNKGNKDLIPALHRAYFDLCDKFMADNLYKHEGAR